MTFAFIMLYIEFSSKDIKETLCHRQTIGKTENEKQYFLRENSFQGSTCFPICQCLPPSSNEHIFSILGVHALTIIQFSFCIFILQISIQYSILYFV